MPGGGLDVLVEAIAILLLVLGLVLATIGLYGMLRMADVFHQLHAAGLVIGPAVVLVLLASIGTGSAETAAGALLVTLFVLVTAPLSAHAIARAARHRRQRSDEDGRWDAQMG